MEILGRGTTSCVVRYPEAPEVAVKILSDASLVESEAVLGALREIDPAGAFLAVPGAAVTRRPTRAERDILRLCRTRKPIRGDKLDPEVPKLTFTEMTNAGDSLSAISEEVGKGAWTVTRAVETAVGVLEALALLHNAGWIHGDLHKHNVAIDAAGKVRLMDFGNMKPMNAMVVRSDVKGVIQILDVLLTLANEQNDPVKYECFRQIYLTNRRGVGKIPERAELTGCVAAEAGPGPASPLRSGKRLFSPTASASASPRTPPSRRRGDPGAGPSNAVASPSRTPQRTPKVARSLF